jgi:hypothetical protein
MERESLKLDDELSVDLCQGGNDKDFTVVENKMVTHKRWAVVSRVVIKRESDGKFFQRRYHVPATESQENDPFEDSDSWTEVFPIERIATFYE